MSHRNFWKIKLQASLRQKSVVWLSGVRRAGKTTLCKSLEGFTYLDCELPSVRKKIESDLEGFLAEPTSQRLVLDEIHRLTAPSEVLKIIADHYPKTQVVATGSSTLAATKKFKDTLVDRKKNLWLTPMNENDLSSMGETNRKGNLEKRLLFGGLPGFFLKEHFPAEEIQDWLDGYWAKDIQELFRIERRSSFLKFFELVIMQSGGIFEPSSFSTPCGVTHPTITKYLSILEATYCASVIRPFFKNKTKEIVSAPKVYGFDTGFVSYFREWNTLKESDKGLLWEMYVLNELSSFNRRSEIFYWRDKQKHEVDFVIKKRSQPPLAIECKWSVDAFDPGNLKIFRKSYPEGSNLLVAQDADKPTERTFGGLVVKIVPVSYLGQLPKIFNASGSEAAS